MNKIFLKKGKEEPVRRFHPWIFSGAIAKMTVNNKESQIPDGDLVEVLDYKNQTLAVGYYNDGSIAVRILSFDPNEKIDAYFWQKRLQNAFNYRKRLDLTDSSTTNAYRLVHAEGDGLPGLIVDIYAETAVVQCHSIGIYRQIDAISEALKMVFKSKLKAIYDKSSETLPPQYIAQNSIKNGYLFGEMKTPAIVLENGNKFAVDWITGQKTGFFLDQRDNRDLIKRYAKDKTVLNAFCYSGGFSVYALKAGAKLVHSIDISPKAIDLTDKNVEINSTFNSEFISDFGGELNTFHDELDTFHKGFNSEFKSELNNNSNSELNSESDNDFGGELNSFHDELNTFHKEFKSEFRAQLNSKKNSELIELNSENKSKFNSEISLLKTTNHESKAIDVLQFLKDNKAVYDVMVVDPPAFAKSMSKRHNAVQAYKRLNAMALRQITEGGILFTFSCSQVVDRQLFYDTIVAAAIEAGRKVRVMHHLTQPADHPVSMFHPEGSYLKGLVLYVE
jgi:23S rRNA G2069 N7-methylase RlmK/C1962 C5-methylase RlmI